MKTKKVLIFALLLSFFISCDRDSNYELETNSDKLTFDNTSYQRQSNDIYQKEYKEALFNSAEFQEILELNHLMYTEMVSIIGDNKSLQEEILSSNSKLGMEEVFNSSNQNTLYENYLFSLNEKITILLNKFPEINMSKDESIDYFEDLLLEYVDYSNSTMATNPCQTAFDRHISYIHGQYDARVFGAAVAFIGSGGSPWGISVLTLGYAVASAVWDVANAIDDFNACMNQ